MIMVALIANKKLLVYTYCATVIFKITAQIQPNQEHEINTNQTTVIFNITIQFQPHLIRVFIYTNLSNPNIRQTTRALAIPKLSSQMVPHDP